VHVCVRARACLCAQARGRRANESHAGVCGYVHARVHVCVCASVCVYRRACLWACVCECMCVCVCVGGSAWLLHYGPLVLRSNIECRAQQCIIAARHLNEICAVICAALTFLTLLLRLLSLLCCFHCTTATTAVTTKRYYDHYYCHLLRVHCIPIGEFPKLFHLQLFLSGFDPVCARV